MSFKSERRRWVAQAWMRCVDLSCVEERNSILDAGRERLRDGLFCQGIVIPLVSPHTGLVTPRPATCMFRSATVSASSWGSLWLTRGEALVHVLAGERFGSREYNGG
jgi:hypothetical protein